MQARVILQTVQRNFVKNSICVLFIVAGALFFPAIVHAQLVVTTNPATGISTTSATLHGNVTSPDGTAMAHFDWGTTILYDHVTSDVSVGAATTPSPIFTSITSLIPNTVYHFRASATSESGSGNGADMSFTTPAAAPTVATLSAQNITTSSAQLVGTVNPRNSATNAHFDWGLTISYGNTTTNSSFSADTVTQTMTFDLGSLSPNMTYHYRISASNPGGTSNGVDKTFTTSMVAPAPSATTLAPQDVSPNFAKFVGSVNPNGSATTVFFEWGPTALYGNTTSVQSIGSGSSGVSVNFAVGGLSPGAKYHYRIVATNIGGTATGNDQSFTTTTVGPSLVPLLTPSGQMMLVVLLLAGCIALLHIRRKVKSRA